MPETDTYRLSDGARLDPSKIGILSPFMAQLDSEELKTRRQLAKVGLKTSDRLEKQAYLRHIDTSRDWLMNNGEAVTEAP